MISEEIDDFINEILKSYLSVEDNMGIHSNYYYSLDEDNSLILKVNFTLKDFPIKVIILLFNYKYKASKNEEVVTYFEGNLEKFIEDWNRVITDVPLTEEIISELKNRNLMLWINVLEILCFNSIDNNVKNYSMDIPERVNYSSYEPQKIYGIQDIINISKFITFM